jgi:hypothetical protein
VACTVDTTDRGPSDNFGIDVGHQPMPVHVVFVRAKVGMLELARQLGNVSQACRVMGYARDSFYRFKAISTSAH